MTFRRFRSSILAMAVVGSVIGCAVSTRIINEWTNPDYVSPRFRKILVIAVSRNPTIRRAFEDEFVGELKAAGVDAAPSYRYIPEEGQATEARMLEAVKQAGADAAMITRLVRVERRTRVTSGFYSPAPAVTFEFYRGYSAAWLGYYDPPTVYQRDIYTSETSLYDMAKNDLVWSGTVQTVDPSDISTEITRYVDAVIEALKTKNLLLSK